MILEKLINKKNNELDQLKDRLFYRNDEDRKEIIEDIKNVIEDLDLMLEEEKKLNDKFEKDDNEDIIDDSRGLFYKRNLNRAMEFTKSELAKYDGKDGRMAYVAVDGTVYDVTGIIGFEDGNHFDVKPGTDATQGFYRCHEGEKKILNNLRVVGVMKQ